MGPKAHQERMIQICNICTFQSILQKYATTMKMMPPSHCPQARRKCWIRGSRNFVQFLSRLEMREMQTGIYDRSMETTFWKLHVFIGISWLGMSLLSSFSLTPIWSFWRVFFPPWLGCALITGWEGDYSGPGEDSDSGSGEDFPETRFLRIPILHYELSHLNSQTL